MGARPISASYLRAALLVSVTTAASPALGQSQSSSAAVNAVDDIVVTANKREEKLNAIGLSVTALSAKTLSERHIQTLDDIASVIPGLTFSHSASNTPILTLRGVGFNSAALGSYPAVSIYVDQAPLPFPVLATHAAFDLQRVEVLKGPQGTLFGQNATGGAINFIAAKPTSSFDAGAQISYARFNRFDGNAYLSGPLTDRLKARVAVTGADSDGWQVSSSRPDDRNGRQRYAAGRLLLDWDPASAIHFSLSLNGWIDRSQPQAAQFIALRPSLPDAAQPAELAAPFSPQRPRAADWSTGSFTPRSNRKFYQPALRADIGLFGDVTLTSLTSYDDFRQEQTQDYDGLPLNIDDFSEKGRIRSFNQEARISNSPRAALRWVVGVNYERSRTFDYQFEAFPDNSVNSPAGGDIDQSAQQVHQSIRNIAVFGNGEYDITSRLTAKVGVRYTHSKNNANMCVADGGDGTVAAAFNFLAGLFSQGPFTPVGATGPIETRCVAFNASGAPNLTPTKLTLAEHNISWRVGLDFKATPDTLLYANISRGYKAGSFPLVAAISVTQYAPVTQESVTAYEAGIKSDLLDHAAHLNASAFYYDYRDKQVLGKIFDPFFRAQNALRNVPQSRILGLDADLSLKPIRGLTLTGSLTYLNSRIQRYVGYNSFAVVGDLSGNALPFTPKWNYGFDVDYRRQLANGGTPFAGLSVEGMSSQDTSIGGSNLIVPPGPTTRVLPGLIHPFKTNPYALLDLRVGFEGPGAAWKLMIFGKNVLNKYYWNNVVDQAEVYQRYAGMPATYGIAFEVRFR